jgi:hypothetical protein
MTNVSRRLRLHGAFRRAAACATFAAALVAAAFSPARALAQDVEPNPETPLQRQLDHVDLALSGIGQFSTATNGVNYRPQNVNLTPSNTFGGLATLSYTKSPLVGLQFNYSYARYTDNFTLTNTAATPNGDQPFTLGVQTRANEYTLGWVFHTHDQHFGVIPFAAVGAGTVGFTPTRGGGQGYLEQARMTYYYSVGADTPLFNKYFGFRAQFRQLFYLAPDYETNYYTDLKRSIASEPTIGFFIKF